MRYWLMKSEPSKLSIDSFEQAAAKTVAWIGIRNYQSRNFMRYQMNLGDAVFFYHSCCLQPGIRGIAEVCKQAYPDITQFDVKSRYYDPKASLDNPRWFNVDIKLIQRTRLMSIKELRQYPELKNMRVLKQGNRLSITPVDPDEWQFILGVL